MKPALAISAIIVAVLVTVVIEETRIKRLQDEITQLRSLPPTAGSPKPPPAAPADEDPGEPAPADPAPAAPAAPDDPAPAPEPEKGFRSVPENYPAPDEERIREIALSPYSQLHYALNLTNRERAYFEDLLTSRQLEKQQLAAQWIDALPADRPKIEQAIEEVESITNDRVRDFLKDEADHQTFLAYDAMQPERQLFALIAPVMDQQGVALEIDKELRLIETLHRIRKSVGAIHWDSLQGMKAIAAGGALERFSEEWGNCGELLAPELAGFLDEAEAKAFLEAREQLREAQLESLRSAIEAIR